MHTFAGDTVIIHYNSDLSGDVELVVPAVKVGFPVPVDTGDGGVMVDYAWDRTSVWKTVAIIPVAAADLVAFIAERVRQAEIAALEDEDSRSVLGLGTQ